MKRKANFASMLRTFLPLLLMVGLQNILSLSVNLVDNFMLGKYSEQSMSAAALVNQIQFILSQLLCGIGAGVSVLGSQYWGKHQTDPIRRILSIALKFGFTAGLIFCLVTSLFPTSILGILTNDTALIEEAASYLSIMSFTYVIFGISAVLTYSMQAVQSAIIGAIMSAITILINSTLNYILIFGNLGAEEMGIKGAAIATVISRIVELITIFVYILFIDKKLRLRLKNLLAFDFYYIKDFIKVALPVMMSGLLWGVGQAAQTAILGHIGENAIAANSIASLFMQLIGAFGMACASASSITMGKTIGEGRFDLVKPYARSLQVTFIIIGAISGLTLFLCRYLIVDFYILSNQSRELTLTFITIFSVAMVGSIYEYPVEGGIISGGGDPKYQAIIDNIFMWCFTIPFAALSAFVFGWSPSVTFIILKADQILKCLPNAIYCNSYKWVKNLTRDE